MKRIIIVSLLLPLFFSAKNIFADTQTFTDPYGNTFVYEDTWTYKEETLDGGELAYSFANANGEILILSFIEDVSSVTQEEVERYCAESNGEYVYKNKTRYNSNPWFIMEYKENLIYYWGSVNDILYIICTSNTNNVKSSALARNIMGGVSKNILPSNSSNSNSPTMHETGPDTLIMAVRVFIVILIMSALVFWIKKNSEKNSLNTVPDFEARNKLDKAISTNSNRIVTDFSSNKENVFVCPSCLETFIGNSITTHKCKECGGTLLRMPIEVSEWQEMSEKQKSNYKTTFLDNGDQAGKTRSTRRTARNSESLDISNDSAFMKFNNRIFPNNCRRFVKRQMQYIIKDSIPDEEYLKIYIYCMTHYLVNGENYDYIVKMLPVAHPELKDKELIKRVAAYAFLCTTGRPDKIDLYDKGLYSMLELTQKALEEQSEAREANADKNKEPYDEERGLIREKPMYFAGVRNTENYLNSLMDEYGNRLHTGTRYSYHVDGIPGMLDRYAMLKEDGTLYGELFVSIYGKDNYQYVPKGYKHPTLVNPVIEKEFQNKESKSSGLTLTSPVTEETELIIQHEGGLHYKPEDINNFFSDINSEVPLNNNKQIPIGASGENIKPAIKFCRNCGADLPEGVKFCRKCGAKIGD